MTTTGKINFVLVGSKSVGKTVYLTSLFIDTKFLTAKDPKTIDYLKPRADQLLRGEYPSATEGNLHELKFEYKDDKFNVPLQIDDVDGHFIETLSEKDENTQRERDRFISNLKYSEGIVFFFPYQDSLNNENIKEFNYQIDTVIAQLKELYSKQDMIPIPAVIAISKWDASPYYKSSKEDEEAIKYIESHTFLRRAKEKIELNFKHLKTIPISATGPNMKELEPYNIEKPIRFFLEETFNNWVEKIDDLSKDKEAQLIFISKIYVDLKLYDNKKYEKLYTDLESEFSKQLFTELKQIKNIDTFNVFEEKNQKLIVALRPENQKKIDKQKISLKKNNRNKWFKYIAIILFAIGLASWLGTNQFESRKANELFESIEIKYSAHNYEGALDDIKIFQNKYPNDENKHKVEEIKSSIEKEQVISKAQHIINDKSFDDPDEIDTILKDFSGMGIVNQKIVNALISKREAIVLNSNYVTFQNNLEKKNFEKAIMYVENNWKPEFGKEKYSLISKILNKKYNEQVENLLKSIGDISDEDEFKNLKDILSKIKSLGAEGSIKAIAYQPVLNSRNEDFRDEKEKVRDRHSQSLKEGNRHSFVIFGTSSTENEPLGFICGGEDEIILQIDTKVYHYDNNIGCNGLKIRWRNNTQAFKKGHYSVKVIEEDIIDNDEYNDQFTLSNDDIIQISNGQTVKKDIGSGYFIELGGQ